MKDIITYKTAVRLKNAGFPQPEPEAGQFWYLQSGIIAWVAKKRPFDQFLLCDELGEPFIAMYLVFGEDLVFAPTATDILRELKSDFDLSGLEDGNWMVIKRATADQLTPIAYLVHDSPAESAAAAWLKIHEKEEGK